MLFSVVVAVGSSPREAWQNQQFAQASTRSPYSSLAKSVKRLQQREHETPQKID